MKSTIHTKSPPHPQSLMVERGKIARRWRPSRHDAGWIYLGYGGPQFTVPPTVANRGYEKQEHECHPQQPRHAHIEISLSLFSIGASSALSFLGGQGLRLLGRLPQRLASPCAVGTIGAMEFRVKLGLAALHLRTAATRLLQRRIERYLILIEAGAHRDGTEMRLRQDCRPMRLISMGPQWPTRFMVVQPGPPCHWANSWQNPRTEREGTHALVKKS